MMSLEPMTTYARLVPLEGATDADRFGNKAAALAALANAGFAVPPGFVVPVDVEPTQGEIADSLAAIPGPVAVRSSGTAEDGARASWAGQFESFLNVEGAEAVVDAIRACRASASSEHARAYGAGAPQPLAVLVQRMVPADAAGVAFSANPVTGADEVVVSATRGLADRLVSGEIDGDEWVVHGGQAESIATPHGALDPDDVREIAALATRVAAARGAPQDIEWARTNGALWLVQARPIVDLPLEPKFQIPEGNWSRDASHFPGPVTPLGATAYCTLFSAPTNRMFEEWALMPEQMEVRCIGYECYSRFFPESGAPPPWWLRATIASSRRAWRS